MPVRAYLYDADGTDREVTLDPPLATDLSDRHLLWVDISAYEESELRQVAALFKLQPESIHHLMNPVRRPRVDNYGDYLQLNVAALHADSKRYSLREIDFVVGPNYVITVHQEPISFLESFDRRVKADSQLGRLDAAAFLLPATVVTGLMGMSLRAKLYQTGDWGFWSVCGLLLLVATAVLLLARRRRWL